jgi:sugar lactone lactonase YvrE
VRCGTPNSRCWFDEELGGGAEWWNTILAQIRGGDVFTVALSQGRARSCADCSRHAVGEAMRMAHDVFISHSHEDKPAADAACAALESKGIRCWIAPRDINPGQDWAASIVEAIRGAKIMLLVFSRHANESPQVKREVERAANSGKVLLPLRIDDVLPEAALEYYLSTPHWLDAITKPFEAHLEKLAAACSSLLAVTGRSPQDAASPITGLAPSPGITAEPAGDRDIPAADQGAATANPLTVVPSFLTGQPPAEPDHRADNDVPVTVAAAPTKDPVRSQSTPTEPNIPTDPPSDQRAQTADLSTRAAAGDLTPDTDTTPTTPARDPGTTPAALANPPRPSPRQPLLQRLSGRTKIAAAASVIVVIAVVIAVVILGQQPSQPSRQVVLPFTGLSNPTGVAVDTAGDVYVTDRVNNGQVLELAAGSSAQKVLPFTGLYNPSGVAVDGTGAVYVTARRVLKLAAGSSAPTVLQYTDPSNPTGVAVDAAGDVYVTDSPGGDKVRVLKWAAGSSAPTVLPFTGLHDPRAVAVDARGDLYVADGSYVDNNGNNSGRVLELAAGSGAPTVLPFTGFYIPEGVAVDAAGDVYVTDTGNNQVLKLAAGSNDQYVVPFTGLSNPFGVAVDTAGTIYVTDAADQRVLKLPAGS